MPKTTTIVYFGADAQMAKHRAAAIRDGGKAVALVRDANAFRGADHANDIEECDRVLILADVPKNKAELLKQAYGDKVYEQQPKPEQAPEAPAAPDNKTLKGGAAPKPEFKTLKGATVPPPPGK